jgi:hypothetical protein
VADRPDDRRLLNLFRVAIALVVVFALGVTAWLIDTAVLNPDVRARRPGWVEGVFDIPFWLPLILTFTLGAAAVAAVFVKAAKRLRRGEDLFAQGYRERKRRELEERRRELDEAGR